MHKLLVMVYILCIAKEYHSLCVIMFGVRIIYFVPGVWIVYSAYGVTELILGQ